MPYSGLRWIMEFLKQLNCITVFVLAASLSAYAQGDNIAMQLQASDDGYLYIENSKTYPQNYTVHFHGGSPQCGGAIAALQTISCRIPAGYSWATVSDNVRSYILFTGSHISAVPQRRGQAFPVKQFTGVAIVNPTESLMEVTFVLYGASGIPLASFTGRVTPYASFAYFAYQWFSAFDWNQGYFMAVGSPQFHAVLSVDCDNQTWTCKQNIDNL